MSEPSIVVPERAEIVESVARQETIPACKAPGSFFVFEQQGDRGQIVQVNLNGRRGAILGTAPLNGALGIDSTGTLLASNDGVLNLKTGKRKTFAGSKRWRWSLFVPKTKLLVVGVADAAGQVTENQVLNYESGVVVHRFEPYAYNASSDGALFYVAPASQTYESRYTDVFRFFRGKVKHLIRIATPCGADYSVAISGIAARSSQEVVYRVSEAHEHRWLTAEGKAFFSGGRGHLVQKGDIGGMGVSKEQYDLTFSSDGRYAAFTERNWNELTYVVLADLRNKRWLELPYLGSFPVIHRGHVVFSSDPGFVNTKFSQVDDPGGAENPEMAFRQISAWALYAFNIRQRTLCKVGDWPDYVQALD